MFRVKCLYLIPEVFPEEGEVYRCLAGRVKLRAGELCQPWACGGCEVPHLLNGEHCLYLEPAKRFFKKGDSLLILRCSLLDQVLSSVAQCQSCPRFTKVASS